MIITEDEKRNVMNLFEGSLNPDDKALASDLIEAMNRGMNGDPAAEADILALMQQIPVDTMLYTACARMIED